MTYNEALAGFIKLGGVEPGVPDGTGPRNEFGQGMGPGQGTQSGLGLIQQKLDSGEPLSPEEQAICDQYFMKKSNLRESLDTMLLDAKPAENPQNEKIAGVLDTIAKKGPTSLRPMLQKLLIMFKYPEYHAMNSQASAFKGMLGKQQKGVLKNLFKSNKDLYKRMLDAESRAYRGKSVEDILMRKTQLPSNAEIMRMIGAEGL